MRTLSVIFMSENVIEDGLSRITVAHLSEGQFVKSLQKRRLSRHFTFFHVLA